MGVARFLLLHFNNADNLENSIVELEMFGKTLEHFPSIPLRPHLPVLCCTVGKRDIKDIDTDNQVIDKWTTDGVKQVNTIHCEYSDLIVL